MFDTQTLETQLWEDLRIIREIAPDTVVGDMRQSLAVSSTLASVPYINIINAQWSPYAKVSLDAQVHQPSGAAFEPFTRLFLKAAAPLAFAYHVLPLNLIRSKYGVVPGQWDIKNSYCAGDYVVYPDIPEIIAANQIPFNHIYLGAILDSGHTSLPDWWDQVPADRPVVFLSLGDKGERPLLEAALDALGRLPVSVIAATTPYGRVTDTPPNVYVADFLPSVEAAKKADMVICNGSNFTAQQALAGGAPVLGLVSNMDQRLFMKALTSHGAAELVDVGLANSPTVERMVNKMLDRSSYREAAQRLAAIYEATDAHTRFKTLVQSAAAGAEAARASAGPA